MTEPVLYDVFISEQRLEVLNLYRQGLTVREMSDELGVTTQRVYQQLDAMKLPSPSQRKKNRNGQ